MARKQKKQSQPILTWNQILARRGINFSRTWCGAVGIKSYTDLVHWCDRQHVHPPTFQDVSGVFEACTPEESVTVDAEGHVAVVYDENGIPLGPDERAQTRITEMLQTLIDQGGAIELNGEPVPVTDFLWSTEVIPHEEENEAVILGDITGSSRDRTRSAVEIFEATGDIDCITSEEVVLTDLRGVKRESSSKPKRARTKITEPKPR